MSFRVRCTSTVSAVCGKCLYGKLFQKELHVFVFQNLLYLSAVLGKYLYEKLSQKDLLVFAGEFSLELDLMHLNQCLLYSSTVLGAEFMDIPITSLGAA